MEKIRIPDGYQQVMSYLILKDPLKFIEFTQAVFTAELKAKHIDESGIVRHCEVKIGEIVIMFGGSSEEFGEQTSGFFIYVNDADTSYASALKNGGTSVMEPGDQEYGRTCGVKDPCGNTWWITSVK